MKKNYTIIPILLFFIAFSKFQDSFAQCTPTFNNGCSISLHSFGLSYSPTSTMLIDDAETACSGPSSSSVINVTAGFSYDFGLSVFSAAGSDNTSAFFSIWLDKNNDGDFADAGERLYYNNSTEIYKTGFGEPEFAFDIITIPTDALTGTDLKFRVLVVAADNLGESCNTDPLDACGTYCGGEIHDYTFNIAPVPICPLTFINGCSIALHDFSLTSGSTTLINDLETACSQPSSSGVINVNAGENYNFDLTVYSAGGSDNVSAFFSIWLDKNNDGDFADTGERLYYNNSTEIYKSGYGPPESASGSIIIPNDVLTDTDLKFRVLVVAANDLGDGCNIDPNDACGLYCGGEAHDYVFNIAPPACNTPDIPTVSNVVVCTGANVTLTASCSAGTAYWYESTTATTPVASGSYPLNNIIANNSYFVACETSATCASNRIEQTVIVNALPNAPTANGQTICSGSTASLSASCASGTAKWYESNTATTVLATSSFTTSNLTLNTTYYVACESGGSPNCVSTRTPQTVIVNALPNAPTANGQTICSGSTASLSASCASGTAKWYESNTATTVLGTGSFTTPDLTINTTYYVACESGGSPNCVSTRTPQTVIVNALPNAPTANGQTICSGSTASLSASCASGTAKWYESNTATTVLGTGSFTTPDLTINTTYYVACESGGSPNCVSTRTSQTITVNALPNAPTANGQTICSGSTASLSASCASGTAKWYESNTATTVLGTGSFTTPDLTINTTYYVACESGGSPNCVSTRTPQTVLINPLPTIPSISTNKILICNTETATLQATGCNGTIRWNNSSSGTSITVNLGGTYSATCENNCGISPPSNQIIVLKLLTPSAPAITSDKTIICDGERATLSASGCSGLLNWNNGATSSSIQVNIDGTFSATCTNSCGTSNSSNEIVIRQGFSPRTPTINLSSPILCGETSKMLTASGCNGQIKWNTNITGTTLTVNSAGTYSAVCETLCGVSIQSNIINVQFLVNPTPTVSNTGPYEIGQKIQLSASGGSTYIWRGPDDFLSTNADVSILNASLAERGVYTVSVTNATGCSATATTNVVVNPCSQMFKFDYVKAGRDFQWLFPITDGMTLSTLPIETGIIATPICQLDTVNTPSVRMQMTGPEPLYNRDIIENIYPYSIFENRWFQIFGPVFPAGEYTLTVTGYSQEYAQGIVMFGPQTIHFTIVSNSSSVILTNPNLNQICAGSSINISFATTGSFNVGNKFEIQLSNANGSFEIPLEIGESTSEGLVNCQIPANIPAGTGYKIRVLAKNPALMSSTSSNAFEIKPRSIVLESPNNDISEINNQKASEKITATNKVLSSGNATYQAGRFVLLQPGFTVNSGAVFKAEIRSCNE